MIAIRGVVVNVTCWHMSAHVSTYRADTQQHERQGSNCKVLRVVSYVGTCRHMLAHIGTYQHISACPQILTHASIQKRSKWLQSEVSRLMSHVGTCQQMLAHISTPVCVYSRVSGLRKLRLRINLPMCFVYSFIWFLLLFLLLFHIY